MIRKNVCASISLALLVIGGTSGYELYRQARTLNEFPPPGRLVNLGGRNLQIDCRGSGAPTVVLESGGDDIFGSLGWSLMHDQVASITRVCAYSRAGYLWSDSRAEPLTAEDGARDIRAALAIAGEQSPFLLMGYSRGALNALIFADIFESEVAALILLEPRHPELDERRAQAGLAPGSRPPLALAKFGRAMRWSGLPRMFASHCETSWYPPETTDACKAYFPHSLDGVISEDSVIKDVQARASQVKNLGELPMLVVTRQLKAEWLGADGDTSAVIEKSESLWRELHAELASWSTDSEQLIVPGSSHQLPYTHPEIVLGSLGDVIDRIRQR